MLGIRYAVVLALVGGVLFLIPAMSLGGIPPLSGFFAKFALIREGVILDQWTVVFFASAVGLLTLYSMIKIWNEAFWKASPEDWNSPERPAPVAMIVPCVALALGRRRLAGAGRRILRVARRGGGRSRPGRFSARAGLLAAVGGIQPRHFALRKVPIPG